MEGRVEDRSNQGVVVMEVQVGALESAEVCAEVFGIPMPPLADKAVHYQQLALWFERHGRHLDQLGFD